MKVFSVVGFTKSGKTTTIEHIIKELKKRGYSVGSVKEIHFEEFQIDTEGSNTYRHMQAGSEMVVARGFEETDILFPRRLDIYDILKFFDTDFVILESVVDVNAPKIITAKTEDDIKAKQDGTEILISGVIADSQNKALGIKAISALSNIEGLVDYIEQHVFNLLPAFDVKCCGKCGMSCKELLMAINRGEKKRSDCVLDRVKVTLTIGDKPIAMVPFVQHILKNNILAVAKELDGYEENKRVEVKIEK